MMASGWQNSFRLEKCSIECGTHVYMGSKCTRLYENSDQCIEFFPFAGYTGWTQMGEIVVLIPFTILYYTSQIFASHPCSLASAG